MASSRHMSVSTGIYDWQTQKDQKEGNEQGPVSASSLMAVVKPPAEAKLFRLTV